MWLLSFLSSVSLTNEAVIDTEVYIANLAAVTNFRKRGTDSLARQERQIARLRGWRTTRQTSR